MTTDSVFQPLSADDPRQVGKYRLAGLLGAGGMGRVYLSYTPGGRPVAVKVVRRKFAADPEFRRRFRHEVANARRIHGLYTALVIDAGVDDETPWLATSYVAGPSLQQVVREYGPLPVRTVLLLLGGIAEALQAIHGVEVVHRDLKPANVLMAADGPRVIDFGIARAADSTVLTDSGSMIGSPPFMAPEQIRGLPVTPATDVFALGALAAYVLSGTMPFGDGPDTAVLYRVVHEEPDLGQVPDSLRPLLAACLSKQPGNRPRPAELIRAAREHPLLDGELRFTENWLPDPVTMEIARRVELLRPPPPTVPPRPAAVPTPTPSAVRTPTAPATAPPAAALAAPPRPVAPPLGAFGPPPVLPTAPPPAPTAPAVRSRGGRLLAGGLALAAVVAAGIAFWPESEDTGPYTTVYRDRELTIPPAGDYEFDLDDGRVVPSGESSWSVGTAGPEFRVRGESDVFVGRGKDRLGAQACALGVESEPAAGSVKFDQVPPDRSFCVRSRATGSVAVLRVLKLGDSDGRATCALSYYRYQG
ncbi:serine/threonine-protein kinase [Kitasatospora sp. NPDC002040]|uniref:serine/threonine-protein kinase n=1 Tax=Kitasatospora sp. NPDC002040 TaxID=3154661 RepID=UPI0033217D30